MSFSAYARQVRDTALPYKHRVSALRSCVQLYGPIGFRATLSFLEGVAGPYQRDEGALLRALEALTASRAGWHADMNAYADTRRTAKQRGQRSVRPGERNPNGAPGVWYGTAQPAALHALKYWLRERVPKLQSVPDDITKSVCDYAVAALEANGALSTAQRRLLKAIIAELQRRLRSGLWDYDKHTRFHTWAVLHLAYLVDTASEPTSMQNTPEVV